MLEYHSKNQFKNQKLSKGDDGKELIYWLNNGKYVELTAEAWNQIMSEKSKF